MDAVSDEEAAKILEEWKNFYPKLRSIILGSLNPLKSFTILSG